VWPALYLYTGGTLLCKGFAQGTDNPPVKKTTREWTQIVI